MGSFALSWNTSRRAAGGWPPGNHPAGIENVFRIELFFQSRRKGSERGRLRLENRDRDPPSLCCPHQGRVSSTKSLYQPADCFSLGVGLHAQPDQAALPVI